MKNNQLIQLADDWEQIELKRRRTNLKHIIERAGNRYDLLGDAYIQLRNLNRAIKPEITRFFEDTEESQLELF